MTQLLFGLAIFFAAHTLSMFRGQRERIIAKIGTLPYRGAYSLISIIGFYFIVVGYSAAPVIQWWTPPAVMRTITMVLMLPVFILFAAAYMPGHIKARVKNPMLIGLKTWALAHLLANGDAASVLLFGAFLVWAVADLIVVKRDNRGSVVENPRAIFDALAVATGLGIYGFIVLVAHVWITGVPLTT